MLTADAEQHREVGVLPLSALREDAAEGAQVTQARRHLAMKSLRQARASCLRRPPAVPHARAEPGLVGLLQALLQGQVLIQQVLVLRGQLHNDRKAEVRAKHHVMHTAATAERRATEDLPLNSIAVIKCVRISVTGRVGLNVLWLVLSERVSD